MDKILSKDFVENFEPPTYEELVEEMWKEYKPAFDKDFVKLIK